MGRDRCLMMTPISGIQNEGASRLTLEVLLSYLKIKIVPLEKIKLRTHSSLTLEICFYSKFWKNFHSVEKMFLFKGFRLLFKFTETP